MTKLQIYGIYCYENDKRRIPTMVVYIKKERFEEILARKNLNQDDFAKMLGINRTYLSTLKEPEKYDLSPGPDLRERMLKILEVKFDDIFFIQNSHFNDNKSEKRSDSQQNQENGS